MSQSTPRRPRPPPGEPVEVLFWRYTEKTAKGMRRKCVYSATVDSDLNAVLWSLGSDRYRLEWRDRKRQVVVVRTYVVMPDQRIYEAKPLRKSKPRELPPARYVAPGTPPTLVPYAPEAPTPLPVPRPRKSPEQPDSRPRQAPAPATSHRPRRPSR